jgi:hypothetical protein
MRKAVLVCVLVFVGPTGAAWADGVHPPPAPVVAKGVKASAAYAPGFPRVAWTERADAIEIRVQGQFNHRKGWDLDKIESEVKYVNPKTNEVVKVTVQELLPTALPDAPEFAATVGPLPPPPPGSTIRVTTLVTVSQGGATAVGPIVGNPPLPHKK